MPTFSEYLYAPWKILGLLFATHPAVPPLSTAAAAAGATASGAQASAAANGALCSAQMVGDQVLNVCNVLGYEMPSFVFWASLLILSMFVVSSTLLLLQCLRLSESFGRVARQLEKQAKSDPLTLCRSALAKERTTAHAWKKFEEGLIIAPESNEAFTTQPVDEIFSRAALIEDNVHGAFFSSVPGILTGLGLLMTFIAILDGLSHVSVSANMDVKGIGGLINGLSGKFVSSIVAVTCAVCFVFVERIAYGSAYRGYRKLVTRLGSLFKRRTSEQLLYSLQAQLITQAAFQRELAQSLAQLQSPSGRTPSEASHGRR